MATAWKKKQRLLSQVTTSKPELSQYALRRRLVVLILMPLALVGILNAWADYQLAGNAATRQDEQLTRLMPLLAGVVISTPSETALSDSVVMLAPDVQQFLVSRGRTAAFLIADKNGQHIAGNAALRTVQPLADNIELHSEVLNGVTWRSAVQRVQIDDGQTIILQLSDGSDPRQGWLLAIAQRVLLPNLLLAMAVVFAVSWGVRRALAPLLDLKRAVELRAPQDLSPIDMASAPQEVRPLVRALNQLIGNAQQQSALQQRFVADAAHQLRTPLAALLTEAQTWVQLSQQSGAATAVAIEHTAIARLELATRRAANLAHQLLTLSKAEAGHAGASFQAVHLRPLLEEVLAMRLDAAAASAADLGLDIAPNAAHARTLGQPWMLRELLLNLVDNALAYSGAHAVITLALAVRENRAVLSVCDNGPGIAAAERKRVLERFYRGNQHVNNQAATGNGLGLAIAHEIAQRHGSRLVLSDANPTAVDLRPGLCVRVALALCENSETP